MCPETLHALAVQHHEAVEDVCFQAILWVPRLENPTVVSAGSMHTVVRLNDGRVRDVITSSLDGETQVTPWQRPAYAA